ncbi:MAG: ATP-binding protein [Veillonellales bacterium]
MLKGGRDFYYKYKLILNSVFLVMLASVLFVYPFGHHFRVTLGVVVLSTLLLYFPKMPIISTAMLSGLGILITRIAISVLIEASDLLTAVQMAWPAFGYYLFFGAGLHLLRIRASIKDVPVIFLKLSSVDLFSNFVEFSIRNDLRISDSTVILPILAGVAILRSVLAVYSYYCLRRYRDFILAEERVMRYTRLTMIFAQLKAELYYLKKSSQDIEKVMERSYWLYKHVNSTKLNQLEKVTIGGQALTIARSIHEIKKDYYRVISGIENIFLPNGEEKGMGVSEIFYIIEQNTIRVLNRNNKDIKISFSCENEFVTTKHYTLVSILNNLIINAIEACDKQGIITVKQSREGDNLLFSVEDNGVGIERADTELIFNPGYSTKYSSVTGKMSTGLGLSHVKNLTQAMNGKIQVASQVGIGTVFSIILPFDSVYSEPAPSETTFR